MKKNIVIVCLILIIIVLLYREHKIRKFPPPPHHPERKIEFITNVFKENLDLTKVQDEKINKIKEQIINFFKKTRPKFEFMHNILKNELAKDKINRKIVIDAHKKMNNDMLNNDLFVLNKMIDMAEILTKSQKLKLRELMIKDFESKFKNEK